MTISQLPDLQNEVPSIPLSIERIGSQRIPRYVSLSETQHTTRVLISCYMDVPSFSRGAHVSRIITAIDQAMEQKNETLPAPSLLEFSWQILDNLIVLHNQSTKYSVRIEGEVVATRPNRINGGVSIKPYEILGETKWDNGVMRSRMGVRTKVCMACPQAQAVIKHNVTRRLEINFDADKIADILGNIPIPSHNQIGVADIWVEIPNDQLCILPFDELVDIIEESASSPTYEYLKRPDEGAAVEELHNKPRFVEDSIREFYQLLADRVPQLPDASEVEISIVNYESTFEYALEAQSTKRLGTVRESLASNM